MIEYTVKVYPNGEKYWSLKGKGPAEEWASGNKYWLLNGKRVTEEEHKKLTSKVIEMTVAEISKALGKQVKVVQ